MMVPVNLGCRCENRHYFELAFWPFAWGATWTWHGTGCNIVPTPHKTIKLQVSNNARKMDVEKANVLSFEWWTKCGLWWHIQPPSRHMATFTQIKSNITRDFPPPLFFPLFPQLLRLNLWIVPIQNRRNNFPQFKLWPARQRRIYPANYVRERSCTARHGKLFRRFSIGTIHTSSPNM